MARRPLRKPVYNASGSMAVYRATGAMAVDRARGAMSVYAKGAFPQFGSGVFEGIGVPVVVGRKNALVNGIIVGLGQLLSAGFKTGRAAVQFVGIGAPTAAGGKVSAQNSGQVAGIGAPLAAGSSVRSGSGIMTAIAALIANVRKTGQDSGTIAGVGAPVADGEAEEGLIALSITQVSQASSVTNLATYSFATQSIGAAPGAGERRFIVSVVGAQDDSAGRTLSSGTIAGVNAPIAASQTEAGGGTSAAVGIIWREEATGTAATIAFTFDATMRTGGHVTYRVIARSNVEAVDTSVDTVHPINLSLDVEAGGVAIGGVMVRNGGSATWTGGLTEDQDINIGGLNSFITAASAINALTTTLSPQMVSSDTSPERIAGCAVSFRPVA